MSSIHFKKGPALTVDFGIDEISLTCHDGIGLICHNVPKKLLPWFEAYTENHSIDLDWTPCLKYLTPFTQQVLNELLNIPLAETRTYQEIAAAIGRPKAVRAVGSACGKNPYPLLIPCHRVVGSQGLGGFSIGLKIKEKLLAHECGTPFASIMANGRNSHDRYRTLKKNSRT